MAEPLGDGDHRFTGGEQQRREVVPQVVAGRPPGQPGRRHGPSEEVVPVVDVPERRPRGRGEHRPVRTGRVGGQMPGYRVEDDLRSRDRPAGPGRLGLRALLAAAGELPLDPNGPPQEVDVRHAESEQFADPEPEPGLGEDHGPPSGSLYRGRHRRPTPRSHPRPAAGAPPLDHRQPPAGERRRPLGEVVAIRSSPTGLRVVTDGSRRTRMHLHSAMHFHHHPTMANTSPRKREQVPRSGALRYLPW